MRQFFIYKKLYIYKVNFIGLVKVMISPISSLMNMEMALYGGLAGSTSAPSYLNGYRGSFNAQQSYPAFYGYNPYQTVFCQQIPQGYSYPVYNQNSQRVQSQSGLTQIQPQEQVQHTIFGCLNQQQRDAIVDCYAKNLEPSESLKSAVTMGAIGTVVMANPRITAHPINYLTTTFSPKSQVNKLFKDAKISGTTLNELWKKNSMIMEEAYSQMHRAEARSKWKFGLFRKRYTKREFVQLKNIMRDALATGKVEEVAKATETLRHAYTSNGWLVDPIGNFKGKTRKSVATQLADLADETSKNGKVVHDNTQRLLNFQNSKMSFKQAFKKAGGKMGLAFGAIEFLMSFGKIKTAFSKDKKSGWKQVGQSAVKSVAHAGGWVLGETAAIWAGAKIGATIGTAFGPGIGTAVGAVIGFIGGSIGMWCAGRAAKKLVGEDVANKIEAENLAKTEEGQVELLQHTAQRIKNREEVNPLVIEAAQKVLNQLA